MLGVLHFSFLGLLFVTFETVLISIFFLFCADHFCIGRTWVKRDVFLFVTRVFILKSEFLFGKRVFLFGKRVFLSYFIAWEFLRSDHFLFFRE